MSTIEQKWGVYAIFDSERFYADLDQVRKERGVSWTAIADATGCAAFRQTSTHAPNPRIDTLVPAAVWADLSVDQYIRRFDQAGEEMIIPHLPEHRPLG